MSRHLKKKNQWVIKSLWVKCYKRKYLRVNRRALIPSLRITCSNIKIILVLNVFQNLIYQISELNRDGTDWITISKTMSLAFAYLVEGQLVERYVEPCCKICFEGVALMWNFLKDFLRLLWISGNPPASYSHAFRIYPLSLYIPS